MLPAPKALAALAVALIVVGLAPAATPPVLAMTFAYHRAWRGHDR